MTAKTCVAAARPLPKIKAKSLAEVAVAALGFLKDGQLGGERCGKPAVYDTPLGPRCEACSEEFRRMARDPNTVINILAGGRARTEEEIARLLRPIEPDKESP